MIDRYKKTNERKSEQLGMSFSTANGKLRKQIMFELVKKCDMDTCYRCGEKIESVDDISIEHKNPWMDTKDPTESFFDFDNIAFSHIKCNIGNTRKTKIVKSISKYKGVTFHPQGRHEKKPWRASSVVNSKTIHIGYYATAKEAAYAFDKHEEEIYGEKAITNESLGLLE